MSEFTLAKYNDNEIKLNIVPAESFEYNKGTYTIKWVLSFGGVSQTIVYELTTPKSIIVTRVLNRNASNTCLSYFWIVVGPEMKASVYPKLFEGDNTAITQVTLVENTGGSFVTPGSNFDWYGFRGTWDAIGTVANCNPVVDVEADFPIFLTSTVEDQSITQPFQVGSYWNSDGYLDDYDYCNEIYNDDFSHIGLAANYTDIANTIPRDKIYFIRNILKKNGTIVEGKHYRFKIPPNGKLWLLAEEHEPTGKSYNMTLRAKGLGLPPTFMWQVGGSGSSWTLAHLLTPTLSKYYYGEWTNYNNGDWYKVANLNTNIPIFTSEEEGEMYEDGRIGEDAAINSGELGYDGKITTGDALDSSDIPSPVIAGSGAGVNVWLLDKGNLNAIFADLYSDTQSIIDDIKKGTWQWGNNPIDFIVSIYYVPFDVSAFYDTRTERVYLGQYDTHHDYTQCKETKSSGQRMVLVNTTIDNVYGDWRDLDFFKYELFLPYVGFVPLDPQIYVGHGLKVELAFDVMTHNIRYYLFADGTVIDRIDGSVGYAIPITGTDMVNKANQNLSGAMNLVKAGSDIGLGAAQMSKGVLTTGFSNVTDGVMGTIGGMKDMMQYPKQIIKGDISASMNIFDINYVYLKITEKQSIYPAEIRQVYNNPSYVCCNLSELSGYCELADVQLVSSCTEREYNEIIQLLKEGVIF